MSATAQTPDHKYEAVLFDLLTALLDSWTLWDRSAGSVFSGSPFKAPSAAPAPRAAPAPKPVVTAVSRPPERPAAPVIVEVIQGAKRNEVKFQDRNEQPANAEGRP